MPATPALGWVVTVIGTKLFEARAFPLAELAARFALGVASPTNETKLHANVRARRAFCASRMSASTIVVFRSSGTVDL
jgi:hypothetical protein